MKRVVLALAALLAPALLSCRSAPPEIVHAQEAPSPVVQAAPRESFIPREPRLIPAETLIRSYTAIFGDILPPEIRKNYASANAKAPYFGWEQYLSALGLPDYTRDLPRTQQSNTIMVAAFEQLAIFLCDRAALRDLGPNKPKPLSPELEGLVQFKSPPVFDFSAKPGPITLDEFRPRFDVLHRTFLGYPAALAPPERVEEFHALYTKVEERHRTDKKLGGLPSHLAGWSAVCQGLARHPEFHHY